MSAYCGERPIVVEVDEGPLTLDIPSVPDYVSRQILHAIYLPLIRLDPVKRKPMPGAAAWWERLADGSEWRFELREDVCWSDGGQITAEDALRGLIAAARHPLWGRYLAILEAADAQSDRVLHVRLRHSADYLPYLLAAVDLAPQRPAHQERDVPYSGPYCLVEASDACCRLLPNRYFADAAQRPPITVIVNRSARPSLAAFHAGLVDVTCNTGFPFDQIAACRSLPEYRAAESGIIMQLEFPAASPVLDASARRALSLAIDRKAIAANLNEGVTPADSFAPACFAELRLEMHLRRNFGLSPRLSRSLPYPLRICYHDYYPNREVLEAVSEQWKSSLGITTELIAVDFRRDDPQDCDVFLALRFPTFPHPWAVLEHFLQLTRRLAPRAAQELLRIIHEWLSVSWGQEAMSQRIAKLLMEAMPVVPLFWVTGHWLQRRDVHGFSYPPDGCFDYVQIRREEREA